VLSPFEKNLEVWRQLWRVVERSDVVVQLVDARDPRAYYCADLNEGLREQGKVGVVLVNKAELLSRKLRDAWKEFFGCKGVDVLFFSAKRELEKQDQERKAQAAEAEAENIKEEENEDEADMREESGAQQVSRYSVLDEEVDVDIEEEILKTPLQTAPPATVPEIPEAFEDNSSRAQEEPVVQERLDSEPVIVEEHASVEKTNEDIDEDLLTCDGLISTLKAFALQCSKTQKEKPIEDVNPSEGEPATRNNPLASRLVIGMVGYPNVGKSSTINVIMGAKKVGVSSTPGKTKHFQTLIVDDDLALCDCPGLVFPHFAASKAELICNGVLPIDQMRQHIPPMDLVCSRVPASVLCRYYGVSLQAARSVYSKGYFSSTDEFLDLHAVSRGFMTTSGRPDQQRSSRLILKDYIRANLVYCHPPPDTALRGEVSAFKRCEDVAAEALNEDHGDSLEDARGEPAREETKKKKAKRGGGRKNRGKNAIEEGHGNAMIKGKYAEPTFTRVNRPYLPVSALDM